MNTGRDAPSAHHAWNPRAPPQCDTSADASGTIAHFRIYGTTAHMQGTVTVTGGGGDITLDAVVVTGGQQITITSFTLTAPGA